MMAEFEISAHVTLHGATMIVEAENEDEARRLAESQPDFEIYGAELVDWRVTDVRRSD